MPLQMTDAMAAALAAPVMRPALLVQMQFATATGYAWSGYGDLVWSGMTFKGLGEFGQVSPIEETNEVENKGITLELSGIAPWLMPEVLKETRILGNVTVWLACFDETGAIVPDPVIAFQGFMDAPEMVDGGKECTATLAAEDDLADLNRPCYRRYTNEDQQLDYPGDTGMQYVAGLQEQITFWGVTPGSINNV
jgi:hypothetical protein